MADAEILSPQAQLNQQARRIVEEWFNDWGHVPVVEWLNADALIQRITALVSAERARRQEAEESARIAWMAGEKAIADEMRARQDAEADCVKASTFIRGILEALGFQHEGDTPVDAADGTPTNRIVLEQLRLAVVGHIESLKVELEEAEAHLAREQKRFDAKLDHITEERDALRERLAVVERETRLQVLDEVARRLASGDLGNRIERQLEPLRALLSDVAQLLDGWHNDGTTWTEWDESVRKRVTEAQALLTRHEERAG